MIAAEYEAIQLCSQLAESTDNKLVIEVLKEISEDEREHAGSFLRLLYELDPEEEKYYKEGAEEVEEEIEDLLKDMKKTLKKKEEKPESKEDESEDKEEEKEETNETDD